MSHGFNDDDEILAQRFPDPIIRATHSCGYLLLFTHYLYTKKNLHPHKLIYKAELRHFGRNHG
jgi:hypothetical protein